MKDIPVGSYVTIRNTSEFYGRNSVNNPAGELGIVIDIWVGGLNHRVRWLHSGGTNSYRRKDLRYWRAGDGKPQPKKEKKQKEKSKPLPQLLEEAEAECRKKGLGTTARFAFVYDSIFEVNVNTACHAQVLNYALQGSPPNYIYTYFHRVVRPKTLGAVETEAYGKWLVEQSPWKDAFVNKDVYKPDSFLLCTTEIHGAVMQGALVATRQPYEHPERVALWYAMYSRGIDGRTAFYLASTLRLDGDNVTIGLHPGGHYPIDVYITSLDKFLNFTTDWSEKTYKESRTSRGCHKLFAGGPCDVDQVKFELERLLRKVKGGKKETSNNPFKKAIKKEAEGCVANFDSLVAYVKENGV